VSDKQDFEAVRGALTFESLEHGATIGQISTAAFAALSRIEAVQKLATEQVEWLQRTKKEAERQRDALKAALECKGTPTLCGLCASGTACDFHYRENALQVLKELEEPRYLYGAIDVDRELEEA